MPRFRYEWSCYVLDFMIVYSFSMFEYVCIYSLFIKLPLYTVRYLMSTPDSNAAQQHERVSPVCRGTSSAIVFFRFSHIFSTVFYAQKCPESNTSDSADLELKQRVHQKCPDSKISEHASFTIFCDCEYFLKKVTN